MYNGNDYLGYYIYNAENGVIYELSLNSSPYDEIVLQENLETSNCDFLYDDGECAIEYNNVISNSSSRAATDNNIITKVLPGVSPQLQNSYICMVGAASNMMFYWSWHGYPNLNKYSSWDTIEKYVDIAYANTYRNDYVPTVLNRYIHSYYPNVKVTSQTIWNPSVSVELCEIDNSRPFMLGFAAGVGSYSETVGHMTMCYGYKKQTINGNTFYSMLLADGHEKKGVYKVWNSKINDCIITLKLGN